MAGAAYVPLDPSFPRDRHLQILDDSQPCCILTDEASVAEASRLDLPVINIEAPRSDRTGRSFAAVDPEALAYILYTSGSSGRPKGVAQNHRNVLHHCRVYTNALRLHARDRLALFASFGFDAAVMDVFGALLNGATLYPVDMRAESSESLAGWLTAEGITVLHSTPTVYRHLLVDSQRRQFPSVRAVVLGGEEALARDVELFRGHFSESCILVNGLGPTESTLALQYAIDHATEIPRNTVPVGYPVPGTEVILLNDCGEEVPGCGTGELAFRSRHVALGYWREPDLTAATFTRDAADPALITYRSGDMARRLPDGRFEFVGRRDLQIKIRGVRIEPAEIEIRLLEHDSVQEAVVQLVEPSHGDRRLVAYVVPAAGRIPNGPELGAFLRNTLPDPMVPTAFVVLESLPLTPNGKLDRRALPGPGLVAAASPAETFVAPATPVERALAGIWASLLRIPRVGVSDNFFDLGGHSLLATQLASRVRSSLHVDLPLRQYFAVPTLGAQAALIERSSQAGGDAVRASVIPRVSRELYRVRVSPSGEFILPPALTSEAVSFEPPAIVPSPTPDTPLPAGVGRPEGAKQEIGSLLPGMEGVSIAGLADL
jgi:amino acid adenylation domain-containing protein